jgi:speckle-type POZ protein
MFDAQMKESKTKTVHINDIKGKVLQEMLRFMYTGKIEDVKANASALIFAAEKYDIKELKDLCVSSLIKNLSTTNIFDTIIIADRYNESMLLYECIEFIRKNYHSLFGRPEWKKIGFGLMLKVMHSFEQDSGHIIELKSSL